MRRALQVSAALLLLVVAAVGACASWTTPSAVSGLEELPALELRASVDPQMVERGAYLVHAVAHCSICHGPPESLARYELGPRDDLSGGRAFEIPLFGTFRAANLSSDPETGIGALSDVALARAIRHGVDRNGRYAAFMALSVGPMADDDLTAVISYLRTLPPTKNLVSGDEWGPIARLAMGSPRPNLASPPAYVPAGEPSVERGRYLANGPAFCFGCHTPMDPMDGFTEQGPRFSGGVAEPDPTEEGFEIVAPNLTPHDVTGHIAAWSEDAFVARFEQGGRVVKGSKMPWESYAQMTGDDLRSLYRYLRTLKPEDNLVGPSRRASGWKPG